MAKFFNEEPEVEERIEPPVESSLFFTVPKNNLQKKEEKVIKPEPIKKPEVIENKVESKQEESVPKVVSPSVETLDVPVLAPSSPQDPLNNKNNPIPVNPVATRENVFDYSSVSVSVKGILLLLKKALLSPGTAQEEGDKYRLFENAIKITLYTTALACILGIITALFTGLFTRNYNVATGRYMLTINPTGMLNQNWFDKIATSIVCSGGAIYIVAGIYYIMSFIRSKGIPFGKYLIITNIALFPFIIGIVLGYPIGSVISEYLGICIAGFCFIYSLVALISGINQCLSFNSLNKNILYNVVNLTIIFVVLLTLYYLFAGGNSMIISITD